MKRYLIPFLLALALSAPAFAFKSGNVVTYTDTTGAHVQDSGLPAANMAPHVATLSALTAVCAFSSGCAGGTPVYPNGVWRDDYAAGIGAPALFFKPQSGTCVSNSMANDGASCVNDASGNSFVGAFAAGGVDMREWGVNFNGNSATDNTTTLSAALTWFAKGNALRCPTGPFAYHASPISVALTSNASNSSIEGAGGDLCGLGYTGSGGTGITITYANSVSALNSVHLKDFTYCTTHAGLANGIALTQNASVPTGSLPFNRVGMTFRGCDGYAQTDYWATAMVITGVSQVDFKGLLLQGPSTPLGIGISLVNGGSLASVIYNFPGVTVYDQAVGISIGANVQGVAVTAGSNFTVVAKAVEQTSGTGTDQLTIADSQFNCTNICIHSAGADTFIHDNYFILGANSALGVYFSGTNNAVARGNSFRNAASFTGQAAFRFDSTDISKSITVSGNVANGLAHSVFIGAAADIAMFVTGNAWGGASPLVTSGATITWDQSLPFADVIAPSSAVQFTQQFSDSNTITWGATIAGGSNQGVLGYSDGTNWTVMAK